MDKIQRVIWGNPIVVVDYGFISTHNKETIKAAVILSEQSESKDLRTEYLLSSIESA